MSLNKRRDTWQFALILLWLVFTVTFAIWWFKFSLENISMLSELQPDRADHWLRQRRMIMSEGTAWLILLVLGGGALIAFAQREKQRARRIREFFASFSHEVKTSLASLRLQAEALKDEAPSSPILDRLIGDTVRLQVQLENSLFLSSQDNLKLFMQPISLRQTVDRIREQWPKLTVEIQGDEIVSADERALRSLLSNLCQNAIVHGKATSLKIKIESTSAPMVSVHFHDNGSGFTGETMKLGQLFHRPVSSSGSGIGLYICRLLMSRMGGELDIIPSAQGFHAVARFKRVVV